MEHVGHTFGTASERPNVRLRHPLSVRCQSVVPVQLPQRRMSPGPRVLPHRRLHRGIKLSGEAIWVRRGARRSSSCGGYVGNRAAVMQALREQSVISTATRPPARSRPSSLTFTLSGIVQTDDATAHAWSTSTRSGRGRDSTSSAQPSSNVSTVLARQMAMRRWSVRI